MTTYVQARDAIVGWLHPAWTSAYPTIPVFYENTTQIALDTVGFSFLTVAVDFQDAIRQGIDSTPETRMFGEVTLRLFIKEGQGTRTTLAIQDYLTALMKYRELAGVTLDTVSPGKKQSRDGWSSYDLLVSFSFFQ